MDLPDDVKERLIGLDEENNQLKVELKRLRDRLATNDEILNELEEENIQLRKTQQLNSLDNSRRSVLEQAILDLKKTIEEKDRDSCRMLEQITALRTSLSSAQSEIAELRRARTPVSEDEGTVDLPESHDVARLQEEVDEAQYELQKAKHQISALELERNDYAERADAAANEAQEMAKHLKEMREQLQNMEAELVTTRSNISIASRGNSMFSEFVNERVKLEADLKLLYSKYQTVRKENCQLSNELDEARLLALRRSRREDPVRCRCQQMSTEVVKLRGRVQTMESQLASAKKDLIDMAKTKSGIDPLLRSFYRSLKLEMESLRQERNELREERDKLVDDNASLTARTSNAEKLVEYANAEVEYLKLQLSVLKEREQKENAVKLSTLIDGENGGDGPNCLLPIPSINLTPSLFRGPVNKERTKQMEQMTPSIADGDQSCPNTLDSTKKERGVQLKKLRFSDADKNNEEDAIRRNSISASELRRMARKQARKGLSKVLPITEPLLKVTAVLDTSSVKCRDEAFSPCVLPHDNSNADHELCSTENLERNAAFSQQASVTLEDATPADGICAVSSLYCADHKENNQNQSPLESGEDVSELSVYYANGKNSPLDPTKDSRRKTLEDVPEED